MRRAGAGLRVIEPSSPPSLADQTPASTPSQWRDGLLMGSLGMLAFSGALPATRLAVPVFGPTLITSARIEVAALLGAITLLVIGRTRAAERRHWLGILWMGFGLAVAYPFFVALALEQAPAAHGAVVTGVAPAVTAAVAVFRLGERPPKRFWIACIVGIAAVLVFAMEQGGGRVSPADLWLLAAMLSVGVAYVEGGRVSRELGATATLCWAMIAVAPFAALPLALSLWRHDWEQATSGPAWAGLAYACVISMFFGSLAWYRGLAAGGVARIGQLNMIQPLLTLLWSALLLGERVTGVAIACAIVVFASMTICVRSRAPGARSPRDATSRGG
jgi:drug/metabolite transporter (DMT)-like permease